MVSRIFAATGQTCIAGSRLFVHEQAHDELMARLSCQVSCEEDMKVRPLMTVSGTKANAPGTKPQEEITPEPIWIERPY